MCIRERRWGVRENRGTRTVDNPGCGIVFKLEFGHIEVRGGGGGLEEGTGELTGVKREDRCPKRMSLFWVTSSPFMS